MFSNPWVTSIAFIFGPALIGAGMQARLGRSDAIRNGLRVLAVNLAWSVLIELCVRFQRAVRGTPLALAWMVGIVVLSLLALQGHSHAPPNGAERGQNEATELPSL